MTVVVKATFEVVPDGEAKLIDPEPVTERDRHFDRSPERSVAQASELAPYLPSAGVTCHGTAHAVGAPTPSASVRLSLTREDRILIDKTINVFGDRARATPSIIEPFSAIPLVYERSIGGAAHPDNPVGCGADHRLPNLVDPDDFSKPTGFGPIGWNWPPRKRLLAGIDTRKLLARIPDLSGRLDWSYFHATPADQRLRGYLYGGEWVELHGMSPTHAVLRTQLPKLAGHARATLLMPYGAAPAEPLDMLCDTLAIDADRGRMSLVWRGNGALSVGEDALGQLGFFVSLCEVGREPSWPPDGDLGDLASAFAAAESGGGRAEPPIFHEVAVLGGDDDRTAEVGPSRAGALPFTAGAESSARASSAEPRGAAALPWDQAAAPQPEPLAPEPPVRDGEDIPVVTDTHLESATYSWQLKPPQDALIVAVKGTYELVPDSKVKPRERSDFCMGELHFEDDPENGPIKPSDVALLKPKADVTLFGSAYASPGKPAVQMKVRFSFGDRGQGFDKTIHVTGDRVWQRTLTGASAGEPAPFERMPLTYARAFGGADYDANPCGVGRGDSPRMPNLDHAHAHVTSPSDTHPPACFAPLGDEWGNRWAKMGTYDRGWLKTRWPYFPADFDWSYFQAAPKDQQLDAIVGDEPFVLEGMHPEHRTLRGKLPGEKPRAFLVMRESGDLQEVKLRCDTVDFQVDEMNVNLVWRGFADVSDSDAPEVLALFLLAEPVGGPHLTAEEVRAAYLEAITPPADEVLDPPAPSGPDPVLEEIERRAAERRVELERSEAELEKQLAEALEEAGVDPATVGKPPPPDREAIAAHLKAAGALPGEIEEVLEALEPPQPMTDEEKAEALPTLHDLVLRMLADGDDFTGFDFEGGDFSGLDFSSRDLRDAVLLAGTFVGCRFDEANLEGAQAGEADFSHASFARARMTRMDLNESTVAEACFDDADLEETEMMGVDGKKATFVGAQARSAVFDGSDWSGASFERLKAPNVDLNRCTLDKARFVEAELPNAGFSRSTGSRASFDRAVLTSADFSKSSFAGCSFRSIDASQAVFDNATLDKADFRAADLSGCSMLRTNCRKADLSRSSLVEANLVRAQLGGTNFQHANMMNALCEAADLSIADMRDANLFGAGFWKATMVETKLDGAFIAQSYLTVRKP